MSKQRIRLENVKFEADLIIEDGETPPPPPEPNGEEFVSDAADRWKHFRATWPWDLGVTRMRADPTNSSTIAWTQAYMNMALRAVDHADGDDADWAKGQLSIRTSNLLEFRSDEIDVKDQWTNTLRPLWIDDNTGVVSDKRKLHCWGPHNARGLQDAVHANHDVLEAARTVMREYADTWVPPGAYTDPYFQWYSGEDLFPYNLSASMGGLALAIAKADDDEAMLVRARRIALHIMRDFQIVGDRFFWRYANYRPASQPTDIGHANVTVNFLIDCYEAGVGVRKDAISRLCNTLRHMYTPGSGFSRYVDGTGGFSRSSDAAYWLRLTVHNKQLRKELYPWARELYNNNNNLRALCACAFYLEGDPRDDD